MYSDLLELRRTSDVLVCLVSESVLRREKEILLQLADKIVTLTSGSPFNPLTGTMTVINSLS